jgi:hypothetical protein
MGGGTSLSESSHTHLTLLGARLLYQRLNQPLELLLARLARYALA